LKTSITLKLALAFIGVSLLTGLALYFFLSLADFRKF